MPAIVRTLWGAPGPVSRWAKVWQKNVLPMLNTEWTCDQWCYVYGRENADLLAKANKDRLKIVLIQDDPWPGGEEDHKQGSQVVRPWRGKVAALLRALDDHGEVIYCDWDVFCRVRDVPACFARLEGRNLFSAYYYLRPRHPERGKVGRHAGVSGNWLHVDRRFLEAVLVEMNAGHAWSWHDELVMGRMLGWPGDEEWLRRYESPVMVQREGRCLWRLESDDGMMVTRRTPIPFAWERLFHQ